MTDSDFLSWDTDLNLDMLLEEYTCEEACESDSDDFEPVVKRGRTTKSNATAGYRCADCGKVLKTVAGFRGHCSKQHQNFNVKATQHRVGADPKASVMTDDDKQPVPSEHFSRVFEKAFSVTLTNIVNDEFLLINTKLAVKETVSCLRRSREFSKIFHDIMFDVFAKSSSTLTSVSDREELLKKLHSYRVDAETETQIMECLQDLHISSAAYDSVVQHPSLVD